MINIARGPATHCVPNLDPLYNQDVECMFVHMGPRHLTPLTRIRLFRFQKQKHFIHVISALQVYPVLQNEYLICCKFLDAQTMSSPVKCIVVPGNGGGGDIRSSNFYGWAEKALLQRGLSVVLPPNGMPDPLRARSSIWIPYIIDELGCDQNTILIGHSSGASSALRIAEKHRLRGLVLVAAYDNDLGDELERESGYFDTPFSWEDIQNNCDYIIQFAGTQDSLVPYDVQERVSKCLQPKCDFHAIAGDDHFFSPPFNELVDAIVAYEAQIASS